MGKPVRRKFARVTLASFERAGKRGRMIDDAMLAYIGLDYLYMLHWRVTYYVFSDADVFNVACNVNLMCVLPI